MLSRQPGRPIVLFGVYLKSTRDSKPEFLICEYLRRQGRWLVEVKD